MKGLACSCTATAAVALGLIAHNANAASGPALELVDRQPLVVRGVAFRPGEKVSLVTSTLLGPRRTTVRASSTGVFRAVMRPAGDACGRSFLIRAIGSLGSRATVGMRGAPCIPPPVD